MTSIAVTLLVYLFILIFISLVYSFLWSVCFFVAFVLLRSCRKIEALVNRQNNRMRPFRGLKDQYRENEAKYNEEILNLEVYCLRITFYRYLAGQTPHTSQMRKRNFGQRRNCHAHLDVWLTNIMCSEKFAMLSSAYGRMQLCRPTILVHT